MIQIEDLLQQDIPQHVAVIMDGNGRWAKSRGKKRIEGHRAGAKSVRTIVEESRKLGIRYLTLFSFSTENWGRSIDEVSALMKLFQRYLDSELSGLIENDVRLRAIGELERLPKPVQEALARNIEATAERTAMDLILAVSYSGRSEITHAARSIAKQVKAGTLDVDAIDEECVSSHLWTDDIPDPDLLIRTSGETRISNFLLWQLAYSEIMIVNEYWPDFNEDCYRKCLAQYQQRERRYGL